VRANGVAAMDLFTTMLKSCKSRPIPGRSGHRNVTDSSAPENLLYDAPMRVAVPLSRGRVCGLFVGSGRTLVGPSSANGHVSVALEIVP